MAARIGPNNSDHTQRLHVALASSTVLGDRADGCMDAGIASDGVKWARYVQIQVRASAFKSRTPSLGSQPSQIDLRIPINAERLQTRGGPISAACRVSIVLRPALLSSLAVLIRSECRLPPTEGTTLDTRFQTWIYSQPLPPGPWTPASVQVSSNADTTPSRYPHR
ncbi:hypothetical protein C8R44DRAFT_891850 [Mycena epipterygia]|nr:hypothetical protein C8R44DRAFT_891850 [Mycena epipterygia]